MLLILLVFSFTQTFSLRVLPCINCAGNLQSLTDFPSPEENQLMIKAAEIKKLTQNTFTGQWTSQSSILEMASKSGLFSLSFKEEDGDTTMILELTTRFDSNPKNKLSFSVELSQVEILTPINFRVRSVLYDRKYSLFAIRKFEDLNCSTFISVSQFQNSTQINEISVDSEECELSLKLILSDEDLPEVAV